jgi:hypothetical protein
MNSEWPTVEQVQRSRVIFTELGSDADTIRRQLQFLAALLRILEGQPSKMVETLVKSHAETGSLETLNDHYDELFELARNLERLLLTAQAEAGRKMKERCAKACDPRVQETLSAIKAHYREPSLPCIKSACEYLTARIYALPDNGGENG